MKSVFEELGGTYHNEGDYLIPDIVAPEAPHIGVWGRERKHYLQQYHNSLYTALLLSGKLTHIWKKSTARLMKCSTC